ncbi:MAG: HAMP domain-containing sensor histidine kinase [Acidobacteria bacterium]|nr:HAMP domain-containing sensor histidine kinase [Acidobacteriota bacterium]
MSMANRRDQKKEKQQRRPRAPFIAAMLLSSLVLTAVLAWQAQYAAHSHRSIAEGVLRDYAALAADEYVRRAANQIGYYGYDPLIKSLMGHVQTLDRLPTLPGFRAEADDRTRAALELVRDLFLVRFDSPASLLYTGNDPEVKSWLANDFPHRQVELQKASRGFLTVHPTLGDQPHTFIYAPVNGDATTLAGFELATDALEGWFQSAFQRAPLLPPSLAKGNDTNAWIGLTVYDPGGQPVFRSIHAPSYDLEAERAFADAYGGILRGMRVVASINPEAASHLVIGGLPRSRLPVLLGLLAVASGLLAAAVLQIRRERALTQLRSDFVARVSHELRTPLTQIRMFAETLLLNRVRTSTEQQRALEIIDKESRRLTHLVENILQFSRGDRGTLTLAPRPRNLAPLVSEFVEDFRPLAHHDGTRFKTRLEDMVVPVDEDALRQILLNLLDNAIKYGPKNQLVSIATLRVNGTAQIRVEDQGPGIPESERERIWHRFHRLERDALSPTDGMGIGLTVVRDLAALHGGRSWVESGSEGGSCFVIELPMAAPEEREL